ncbi:hypothetical protein [Streptomyces sp. UNOB3_S3]|uniref:hypothetical protein n=1 Tax=Streptomyces sp. UNOB3_S3 TaxID=2871682 RepID=UPI001E3206E8|nr:hypothetical protein [Streptomyces sp. UNOB3_S3]
MDEEKVGAVEQPRMRPVFTCVSCGCVYLPPKSMEYPERGTKASPLHCGEERCRRWCAELPEAVQALMGKAAWSRAERWANRELSALPERAGARTARRARPGASRSKLR